MGFLDKLFGKRSPSVDPKAEQAVIVHFQYGSTDLSKLFALEERLELILESTGTGELDGNEVAVDGSDGYLFMYGVDADSLFEAIRRTLEESEFMNGASVSLRYGPPEDGVKETQVEIRS